MVIVGAGIAGLGCAYNLWSQHGIQADVYEYNTIPGGRIRTLRGYFDDGQLVEEHAEFINPEHTKTLALAKSFGLTLDNTDKYPAGTHANSETMRFGGRPWSQEALNKDWHDWAWKLFHDAAFKTAPWPVLYNSYTPGAKRFDQMSVSEWIDTYIPGGVESDFGALCVSAVLDEFGGPPDENPPSISSTSSARTTPRPTAASRARPRRSGEPTRSGTSTAGPTCSSPGSSTACRPERSIWARSWSPCGPRRTADTCALRERRLDPRRHRPTMSCWPCRSPHCGLVDLSGVSETISPLHLRAINEEPLGSNSKFFAQCDTRVWNTDHATGNAYCGGVVEGAWDPTVYQPGKAGVIAALPGGIGARIGEPASA